MTRINTKFQTASVAIPVLLLILLVVMPSIQRTDGSAGQSLSDSSSGTQPGLGTITSQAGCTYSVNKQTQNELASINATHARSLAMQNSDFQSKTTGYGNTFDSIFVEGTFDSSCTATWKDVNVVYDLTDSKGQYVKHVIASEDPLMNAVLGVSEQVGASFAVLSPPSHIWSGYQFWYYPPNNNTRYPVWETTASWQVPTVYYPTNSTYNPACNSTNGPWCDASVWNGLQDRVYGSGSDNNLAQGGSNSNMTCTTPTNCTKQYSIWYEFLGNMNNGVFCPNITVNPGDNFTSDISDSTRNSSATTSQYFVSIQDLTFNKATNSSQVCGAQSYSYPMNYPQIADYIVERNNHNFNSTIANFSSITMTGTMYYNNSYNSIQAPVNKGYFGQILMEN